MSRFKFKGWIFDHLFPYYFKERDTYKDQDPEKLGRGLLQRFLDIGAEYFDDTVSPEIDNFLDIIDWDKTPSIFLNYFWEYFGFIPYAFGAQINTSLSGSSSISLEETSSKIILNSLKGFPKADARKILKYAISLFKIRGTENFYRVLGRFYSVDIQLSPIACGACDKNLRELLEDIGEADPDPVAGSGEVEPLPDGYLKGTYEDHFSTYGPDVASVWPFQTSCDECLCFKVRVGIYPGMWELIQAEDKKLDPSGATTPKTDQIKEVFDSLINKFLPINAKLCGDHVDMVLYSPTIEVRYPPVLPVITKTSEATITLNFLEYKKK